MNPDARATIELAVTPTLVKHWFQYRCERQARYLMTRGSNPYPAADHRSGAWADEGIGYEAAVVDELAKTASVLRLDGEAAERFYDFLRREADAEYAYQCPLDLSDDAELRARWRLPETLQVGRGFADLIRVVPADVPTFRLIDIKQSQRATAFHRAQLAAYALLLERLLERMDIPGRVDDLGEIWHASPHSGGITWERSEFKLSGYRSQVFEFFSTVAPRLAAVPVTAERDDTAFHLYFKCEQCRYLTHCRKSIADELPCKDRDVSAVVGLSRQGKASLSRLGIRSIGGLAATPAATLTGDPSVNWSLRQNAELITARAASIATSQITRLPRRYTHAMPAEFDLAIAIAADFDPVEGRLAAVGCLCEWGRGPSARREAIVEPVAAVGEEPERLALLKVLALVVAALDEADRWNADGSEQPVRAHLFVYEPSEAADLRAALGRHLGDPAVRTSLLHILRMFPPDEIPPEPEYKGVQHLPASAIRAVFDDLYALPVSVAHDLRSVTTALAAADPLFTEAYLPEPQFSRPFSSRLNIEACRGLKDGSLSPAAIADDMARRLRATISLAHWLAADNRVARGTAEPGFLRLKKKPFRWQTGFDPLDATELDVIRAQELLDRRCRELDTLVQLARPWEQRRNRLQCIPQLQLISIGPAATQWTAARVRFAVPPDGTRAEIGAGEVGLILTDDDPDLRLDSSAWADLFVELVQVIDKADGSTELVIDLKDEEPVLRRLREENPADRWFLDRAYLDLTGRNMDTFLHYLHEGPKESA